MPSRQNSRPRVLNRGCDSRETEYASGPCRSRRPASGRRLAVALRRSGGSRSGCSTARSVRRARPCGRLSDPLWVRLPLMTPTHARPIKSLLQRLSAWTFSPQWSRGDARDPPCPPVLDRRHVLRTTPRGGPRADDPARRRAVGASPRPPVRAAVFRRRRARARRRSPTSLDFDVTNPTAG